MSYSRYWRKLRDSDSRLLVVQVPSNKVQQLHTGMIKAKYRDKGKELVQMERDVTFRLEFIDEAVSAGTTQITIKLVEYPTSQIKNII